MLSGLSFFSRLLSWLRPAGSAEYSWLSFCIPWREGGSAPTGEPAFVAALACSAPDALSAQDRLGFSRKRKGDIPPLQRRSGPELA